MFSCAYKYAFSILCYIAYNYEMLESLIPYGRMVMLNKLWLNKLCHVITEKDEVPVCGIARALSNIT